MWPFSSFRRKAIKISLPTNHDEQLTLFRGEILWIHLAGEKILAKIVDFNEEYVMLLAPSTDCSNVIGLNTFAESQIIARRGCIVALERPYPSIYTK